MAATIEVWLDDDRRFIRQRVSGVMEAKDFTLLDEQTRRLVADLRDPQRVAILADASAFEKATFGARQAMIDPFRRPDLHRLAVFGMSPFARTMMRLILLASRADRVRTFSEERDAIAWLLS
jgi:hypothetical protein